MTSETPGVSFPPLVGPRLRVRAIERADLPALWEWLHGRPEAEWRRLDAPYFTRPSIDRQAFLARFTEPPLDRRLIEAEGRILGTVSSYWEHESTRWLEAGVLIFDPADWSQGFGTEALRLWVSDLFARHEVARVGLTTWSGNPGMMRCAEKLGFRLEGRLRRVRYWDGRYYDSLRYGVLREEWNSHGEDPA